MPPRESLRPVTNADVDEFVRIWATHDERPRRAGSRAPIVEADISWSDAPAPRSRRRHPVADADDWGVGGGDAWVTEPHEHRGVHDWEAEHLTDAWGPDERLGDGRAPSEPLADAQAPSEPLADPLALGEPLADAQAPGEPLADAQAPGEPLADPHALGEPLADAQAPGEPLADAQDPGERLADPVALGEPLTDPPAAGERLAETRALGGRELSSDRIDGAPDAAAGGPDFGLIIDGAEIGVSRMDRVEEAPSVPPASTGDLWEGRPSVAPGRRTIVITGRGAEGRLPRRRGWEASLPPHERSGFRPDRLALWAVLLGLLLLLVAATSSHAAILAAHGVR